MADGNQFWQINLNAIKKRDPDLAGRLGKVEIDQTRIKVGRAQDGSPILGVKTNDGRYQALNDLNAPHREADQWVRGLSDDFLKQGHVLLLGFGTGYHAYYLNLHSDQDTQIWVVEPDMVLFKTAMHLMDWTELINSLKINWAVGLNEKGVRDKLFSGVSLHRIRTQGIKMAMPVFAQSLYKSYRETLAALVWENLQIEGLKFRTGEEQGQKILENVLANLKWVLKGANSRNLENIGKGSPALVIAPGPSLEESLPFIADYQEGAWLICVDTAHRILLKHGMCADLVVSLDFTELNARHFDNLDDHHSCLLAYPGIHPSIPAKYEGRSFFFDHAGSVQYDKTASPFLSTLQSLGPLGFLISYGSTAHAAYHAAVVMGASPIILIGHDLSFPDQQWYAAGAMQNDLEQPEREQEPLLQVHSNSGDTVWTSGLYKTYLDTFSLLIKHTGAETINSSPKGAYIEGCHWKPLDKALELLPDNPIDKTNLQKVLQPTLSHQREQVVKELNDLASASQRARQSLRGLIKRLNQMHPNDTSFAGDMIQLMKSFVQLSKNENAIMNLCSALCSRSTLVFMGQLGRTDILGGGSREQNQAALERCENLLNDFDRSLKIHGSLLEKYANDLKMSGC